MFKVNNKDTRMTAMANADIFRHDYLRYRNLTSSPKLLFQMGHTYDPIVCNTLNKTLLNQYPVNTNV